MNKKEALVEKLAEFIYEKRFIILAVLLIITFFFMFNIPRTKVQTILSDMLPHNHQYIKTHNEYVNQLGEPFKVNLMLEVKEGTIFNVKTLQKIREITDSIDSIPGVNHNQIYSLASSKLKKYALGAEGVVVSNIMPEVPKTEEEAWELRDVVRLTKSVYGIFVSRDEKSTLFNVSFIPRFVDYQTVYQKINEIIAKQKDSNHLFYAAGEPLLVANIANLLKESYLILGITAIVMVSLLSFYFRNVVGVIVPSITALISAIWGLGMVGVFRTNIDPLGLVVPVLITARALSHSVQMTERYFELFNDFRDVKKVCITTITSIFPPGMLGIVTDIIGILLIALAPIPIIQKLAYISAFWAFSVIFSGMVITPILLSMFRPPSNIPQIISMDQGVVQNILHVISRVTLNSVGRKIIMAIVIGIIFFGGYQALKVGIGDVRPGTPILWPDSFYNISVDQINKNFPGVEELYILFEGEKGDAIKSPQIIKKIDSFQKHMEESGDVVATFSIANFIRPYYKLLNLGYPKWEFLPDDPYVTGNLIYLLSSSSSPGDFDKYFSRDFKSANVVIWYKDHRGEHIRRAINWVKAFKDNDPQKGYKIRLASGNLGVLAAVNEAVEATQLWNYILVMGFTFLFCAFVYRSFVAALFLAIPLNIVNIITLALMSYLKIGLNINTLPVVSLGIGIGIDYGIYLLTRICEENSETCDYSKAVDVAIKTTGKAIFFTASTMAAGTILWYFISNLRFNAEMGLLLTLIMTLNMVFALSFLPCLVVQFKPKFAFRNSYVSKFE